MKELMLGNKAVARGLYEAGCKVISSYPGTPSTEITEEAAAYKEVYCEWAPNEKVALEVAHGATLGGVRAACAMKHVGLNVAADPLFTISYQGLNAGLVVCVADDPGMHSSQNEQDSRHYAIAAKLPMLEPSDSEESRVFAKKAFEMSEKFNTPVLLKMVTRVAHSQSIVDTEERVEPSQVPYVKDPTKVMMTLNSRNAHVRVEQRTKDLIEYAENCEFNRVEMGKDTSVGIITDSTSYQYAREVLGEDACILKLGLINPLPEKLIKDFAAKVDRVVVLEELDPIIENHCKQLGINVSGKDTFPICGEFSQNLVRECMGVKLSEKAALIVARITVVIISIVAVFMAGNPDSSVFEIVSFAWAGFGATFGPVVLLSLFWRRANKYGAISGMISGGIMIFLWKYVISGFGGVFAIYELLPAFIVAIIVNVVVSLLTKAPSKEVLDKYDEVRAIEINA